MPCQMTKSRAQIITSKMELASNANNKALDYNSFEIVSSATKLND